MKQRKQSPATAVIVARSDVRHLAALAEFYEKNDSSPPSVSALIRWIIEDFLKILRRSEKLRFYNFAEAKEYLNSLDLQCNAGRQANVALAKQIAQEEAIVATTDAPDLSPPSTSDLGEQSTLDPLLQEAIKRLIR